MAEVRLGEAPTKQEILSFFQRHGFSSNSMINKGKLLAIVNTEYKRIQDEPFNTELIEEIWNESEASSKGEIYTHVVAEIVLEAEGILRQRIEQLHGPDGSISATEAMVLAKKQELQEYREYYYDQHGKLNILTKQKIDLEKDLKSQEFDLRSFTKDHDALCRLFQPPRQMYSTYTRYRTQYKKTEMRQIKSAELLVLFHIINVLLLLELLASFHRLSFISLGVYFHSYYILLLQYYHQLAVLYWIMHCSFSMLLDATFLLIRLLDSQFLMPFRFSEEPGYNTVIDIFLLLTIAGRALLICLYLPQRALAKDPSTKYYFNLLGHKMELRMPGAQSQP